MEEDNFGEDNGFTSYEYEQEAPAEAYGYEEAMTSEPYLQSDSMSAEAEGGSFGAFGFSDWGGSETAAVGNEFDNHDCGDEDTPGGHTHDETLNVVDSDMDYTETRDGQGNIFVTGDGGDDNISVNPHYEDSFWNQALDFVGLDDYRTADGVMVSDSNGNSTNYLGEEANRLIIQGGAGNDTIDIDERVTNTIKIEGGDGDDNIHGGGGREYIDAGQGNDTVDAGGGNNIVYGGQGNDAIEAGDGNNYIDGGRGDDAVNVGDGNNFVSGGRDNDSIRAGDGNNVITSGAGDDMVDVGDGTNTVYSDSDDVIVYGGNTNINSLQFDDTLGNSISFAPGSTSAFTDRVNDDLDTLRALPTGQQMLGGLDGTGQSFMMERNAVGEGNSADPNVRDYVDPTTGTLGNPTGGTIGYDPLGISLGESADWQERPPVVGLFHEMAHNYNYGTGTLYPDKYGQGGYTGDDSNDTGVNNRERQAVGLPIDHDKNAATPEQTINPEWATENGLRGEIGQPPRTTYRSN